MRRHETSHLTLFCERRTLNLMMRRLLPFFSLLLAVVWLPATQHCAMEATGLFAQTCSDGCESGASSARDGCGSVENGAYKSSGDTLKVPAPALVAAIGLLCSHLVGLDAVRVSVILPSESFDRSRDWVSTWHFVRRAASAPRAPSLSVA